MQKSLITAIKAAQTSFKFILFLAGCKNYLLPTFYGRSRTSEERIKTYFGCALLSGFVEHKESWMVRLSYASQFQQTNQIRPNDTNRITCGSKA